ncbi:hypothetical protein [Paractinoplanes hotanensis]|uniref:Uncharacterized protein n=1 Tax=Paractinoplanes hotanensis TaxID=2906497 RepID=A0ABT0Y0T3_9ACTN|nr:hypothetical protein [Actinoplanes hotanensis]MCM4079649.1 hypothetical protein [Actinoplanes hotanensis]
MIDIDPAGGRPYRERGETWIEPGHDGLCPRQIRFRRPGRRARPAVSSRNRRARRTLWAVDPALIRRDLYRFSLVENVGERG